MIFELSSVHGQMHVQSFGSNLKLQNWYAKKVLQTPLQVKKK